MRCQGRQFLHKLSRYGCKEHSCMTTVAFAPLEKETGAELALVGENLGHCAGYCRLASTSHAI
jgi:hypothetical protein